jgi:3-oxo-4-pregnene-20-carboxyl-CoA dehydrogenase alpha subunit
VSVATEIAQLAEGVLTQRPEDPWRALVEAGLLGLGVPEACGGDGLGVRDTALVLTALGRRAASTPALVTAIAAHTLARHGDAGQQETALRPVVEAGAALTVALSSPLRATAGPETAEGRRTQVDGVAINVPYADVAHRALVPVVLDGAPQVLLVDLAGPGAERVARPTSSGVPAGRVAFTGAEGSLVPGAAADLHRIAGALAAAYADGLVAGALALTAQHVAQRHQFGRPLVTLQAVALQLADVFIVSRTLHLAATAAATALDEPDPDGPADPEVAALLAVEDARSAVATCHHLHGGTGLDLSYPLPSYSAAATDLAHLIGGPDRCLDALADRLEPL